MEKESSDNKIATLSGEIFDDLEARMLRLAMSDGESHEDIESVLDGCGIGKKPFKTQIIAFNLFKSHPEIQISKETTLALMRAKVTCRERYLQILPHLLKILKTLDDREIRILLIKGGAMKAYRPDCPRWMADVDIVVPEDKYEEAVELSEKVGYKPLKRLHSTDLKDPVSGQTFVDIHHYISTNTNKGYMLNDGLWKRAINIPVSFFPHHVLVPCPEDMMFISLVNFWKNVNDMTSEGSVASLFFDLKLLKEYKDDLGPSFKIKNFFPITDLKELLDNIKNDKSPEGNDIDGIILQRIDKPFFQEGYEPNCYKFKPSHLNTIDFLLKFNKKDNIFDLYLIEKYYDRNFANIFKKLPKEKNMYRISDIKNPINIRSRYFYKGEKLLIYFDSPFYPNLGTMKLTENWNKNNYPQKHISQINDLINKMKRNPQDYHNKIVELSLTDDKKWVPLRVRTDKTLPNSYKVGQSNVSVIFDPIKPPEDIYFQKKLTMNENGLDIIHKINQTFRKYIIEKYVRKYRPYASVIDLCGGRGADEFNLYSNGVSNFFVIDNDTTALKRYFDRTSQIHNKEYEPLTTNYYPKTNWLNINLLNHKLDKNYDAIKKDLSSRYEFYRGKVDIVLMNYAIHYLCDDIEKIKSLGEFVNSVLRRDGIFIITYFDGDEIMKFVENNEAKIGPFDIKIVKQDKDVTIAKMPLPTIKEGSDIYAEEPLVKKDTVKLLEENLKKSNEFSIYNETKRYIDDIQGFEKYIDYYKLIKVGIYCPKNV